MKKLFYFYTFLIFLIFQSFAAQQTINIGTTANDGTGDTLRGAFVKVNENFTDVYSQLLDPSGVINFYSTGSITNILAIGANAYYIGSSNIVDVINDALSGAGVDHTAVVDFGGTGTITNAAGVESDAYYTGNVRLYPMRNVFGDQIFGNSTLGGYSFYAGNYGSSILGVVFPTANILGWSSSSSYSPIDLRLYRDAAGTLAQRNGANAQTFRIYETYSDSSNFSRTSLTRDSTGLVVDAQKSGTGLEPTYLLDLKTDGASRFRFYAPSSIQQKIYGNNNSSFVELGNDVGLYTGASFRPIALQTAGGPVNVSPSGYLAWPASAAYDVNPDTRLYRDAAGTLAQRNGANAQTSRLYSTYTDASNYERLALEATSGNINIVAQTEGTGADNIDITLSPAGAGVVNVAGVLDGNSTGTITNLVGIGFAPAPSGYTQIRAESAMDFYQGGFPVATFQNGEVRFYTGILGLGTGATRPIIVSDAAGTLAQRNGVNAQTSRIYGTYTDSSNYERLSLSHDGSGVGTIGVESGGSGSANQSLKLQVAGGGALYVEGDTAGNARGERSIDMQLKRDLASNVASGGDSVAVGGHLTVSGSQALGLGWRNTASGQGSAAVGGWYNNASGQFSTAVGGRFNYAGGLYSLANGEYAKAYLYGQHAHASGYFAAEGDAQVSRLVARNTTSGTTPADLFLDGVDDRLVLPANSSWKFKIGITARGTDAGSSPEKVASYEFKGTITRDGANGTTLPWAVTKVVEGETESSWDANVTADDTNESLNINCVGGVGDNVRWVAVIELIEVGG